jgi:membrane protein CcdC involved in cytochrome C biogenesis
MMKPDQLSDGAHSAERSRNESEERLAPTQVFHPAAWRAEAHILGATAFIAPLFAAASMLGFAALLRARLVNPDFVNPMVVATLEAFLPLAASIVLLSVAARDDAIEVQLSVATPYHSTLARRTALILGWWIVVEAAATALTIAVFPSALMKTGPDAILVWLAPTLWLSAIGILLALLLHSRATAVAVLGIVWILQLAFHGYFASYDWTRPWFLFATLYAQVNDYWRVNRLELIATAIVGLVVSWMYLHNSEWRFRGEDVSA